MSTPGSRDSAGVSQQGSEPIKLDEFKRAIKELDTDVVLSVRAQLINSIDHLRRSNDELRQFITDNKDTDSDIGTLEESISENLGVIGNQYERVQACDLELEAERGIDTTKLRKVDMASPVDKESKIDSKNVPLPNDSTTTQENDDQSTDLYI